MRRYITTEPDYSKPFTGGDGDPLDFDGFNNLLEGLDPYGPPAEPEGNTPPASNPTEPTGNPPAGDPPTPNEPPAEPNDPANPGKKAFAQMRIANRNYEHALKGVLQHMGVDPNLAATPEQILEMLDNANVVEQAEQLKVPPELLQRLQYMERQTAEAQAERLANAAQKGFEDIKTTYSLTPDALKEFATQLMEDGINPFEQEVDIVAEYKLRNFDVILENERKKAIAEALNNQNEAQKYSTTPSRTQGKPPATAPAGTEINTWAGFDRLLQNL